MRISDWSSDVCSSDLYEETAAKVERGLAYVSKIRPNAELNKVANAVLDFGSPGIGVISLREQELSAIAQARRQLQVSREAAQRLNAATELVVGEANKGVLDSAAGAKQTSAGGKLILIAVAGVSLAAAFLLGWLYIGRRVGLPLTALTGVMARLANRDWQTDVTDRSRTRNSCGSGKRVSGRVIQGGR